jgi:hypothetical protein
MDWSATRKQPISLTKCCMMNINRPNTEGEVIFKLGDATLPKSAEIKDLGHFNRSTPNFPEPHQLRREEGVNTVYTILYYTRANLIQRQWRRQNFSTAGAPEF